MLPRTSSLLLLAPAVAAAPQGPSPEARLGTPECVAELGSLSFGPSAGGPGPLVFDGDVGAAGRSAEEPNGVILAGKVWLVRRSAGAWTLDVELQSPAPCAGETYGAALALEGDTLVVGAPAGVIVAGGTPACASYQGSVYVYDLAGGAPVLVQTLTGGPASKAFGQSLALAGGVLAVGDPRDGVLATDAGRVSTFELVAGSFVPLAEVAPPDLVAQDWFGWDVALSGGVLASNAVLADTTWIHRRQGATWVLEDEVEPLPGESFAGSMDLDRDTLVQLLDGAEVAVHERGAGGWARTATVDVASTELHALTDRAFVIDLDGDRFAVGGEYDWLGPPFGKKLDLAYAQVHARGAFGWRLVAELGPGPGAEEQNGYGYAVTLHTPELWIRDPAVEDVVHFVRTGSTTRAAGAGLAGSGGLTPELLVDGCPVTDHHVPLQVSAGLGGAVGVLAIGEPTGGLPFVGGRLWAFPWYASVPHVLGGAPGAAGAGTIAFHLTIPPTVPAGNTLVFQAAYLDPGAPAGVSLSNARSARIH